MLQVFNIIVMSIIFHFNFLYKFQQWMVETLKGKFSLIYKFVCNYIVYYIVNLIIYFFVLNKFLYSF